MSSTNECVITGAQIPKDLAGIDGLECGFQAPSVNESRLLITGTPGSGKSTFLNSNPNLLMLDEEMGGRTVADPKALRWTPPQDTDPAQRDKAYISFVDSIIARKLKGHDDIQMIGIDSFDELIETFLHALCLRHGVNDPIDLRDGSGNGYTVARKDLGSMLDRIHRAGLGWAIIAHSGEKTIRMNGEEKRISSLSMSDSFRGMVMRKCEHFLFLESGVEYIPQEPLKKTVKGRVMEIPQEAIQKPCRFLRTAPGGLWKGADATDLKVRVPLPDQIAIPPTGGYQVFAATYANAVKELIGE